MKSIIRIEIFEQFEKVTFYTFRFENEAEAETGKFFDNFETNAYYQEEISEIANLIKSIGSRGAEKRYFRTENAAYAFPPELSIKFVEFEITDENTLRLFCVWVSESIVILCNGGVKKSQKIKKNSPLEYAFRFANSMSMQINNKISKGSLKVIDNEIVNFKSIILNFDSSQI